MLVVHIFSRQKSLEENKKRFSTLSEQIFEVEGKGEEKDESNF